MIDVQVNLAPALRAINAVLKQLPFATAQALNQTANDFQRVEQEAVLRNFTVRQRSYILNSIKRNRGQDFATKDHLVAVVRIDPQRNQLAKFETGGMKVAIQGKPFVAIPLPGIKRTKRDLVPRRLYPSAFKPFIDLPGDRAKGQERTFIVPTKGGDRILLQRFGGTRGKQGVRALYLFVHEVKIDDRLHFHENAVAVARASWAPNFRTAWVQALRTAR